MIRALYLLFVLSGAAGLIYESIWTRYLGLFVGHDAYAQIIVLVIFLGGMSAGALAVSRQSARFAQPLYGYVGVEFAVGIIGTVLSRCLPNRDVLGLSPRSIPELAGTWMLPVAKWGIASALILPQSVLLGATFPLMSAGVLRLDRGAPGRSLAMLYFANSLGAAAGVLIAGFYLVSLAGLPGTLLTAAMLNLVVAGATVGVIVAARNAEIDARAVRHCTREARAKRLHRPAATPGLERLLLWTSLGTAVASFIYEIDWIRMLALVLGSATHSFELMLSAFILGLALGAWWIRSRADRLAEPAPHSRPGAVAHGLPGPRHPAALRAVVRVGRRAALDLRPERRGIHRLHHRALRSLPAHHAAGHLLRRHDPAAHHPDADGRAARASGPSAPSTPGIPWARSSV